MKQRGREREKINYFIATRKKILFIRIACTSIWPTIQDKQQQQQPKWEERFDFSFFYNRFSSSAFRLGVINRFESNGYFVAQDCRSFLFSSLLVLNICKWCCFSFAVNNCSGNNRHTHTKLESISVQWEQKHESMSEITSVALGMVILWLFGFVNLPSYPFCFTVSHVIVAIGVAGVVGIFHFS